MSTRTRLAGLRPVFGFALLAVLVGLAAAGCGGSSGGSHPESQAAYTSDLQKICKEAGTLSSVESQGLTPATLSKVLNGYKDILAKIQRIVPPSQDKAKFGDLLTKMQFVESWIDKMGAAIKSGDAATAQKLQSQSATIAADGRAINADVKATTGRSCNA